VCEGLLRAKANTELLDNTELSALEAALAAAPREVREGGVGAEARSRRDRLLEVQQEAERAAKQEAAAEAARLTAEQVWGAAQCGKRCELRQCVLCVFLGVEVDIKLGQIR